MVSPINPKDWLLLKHIVRFGDIDAAGVIHFHHLLRWSHEAWEESLQIYGLEAKDVFPSSVDIHHFIDIALPIVHCEADFMAPIRIADELEIHLAPLKVDAGCFQVKYAFKRDERLVAHSLIKHRAINVESRCRCDLPEDIHRWLEASSIGQGVSSL